MMNVDKRQEQKPDYQALQDELELRYGAAMAQEIIDEIRKVEDPDFLPDYITVKAASEVLEFFRAKTKEKLGILTLRRMAGVWTAPGIIDLDDKRMEKEVATFFGLYFQAQHIFYRLYARAMSQYTANAPKAYRAA